ncbi:MAG: cytochrome c biogenesis protein CcsA [Chloroflexi bacterium]|nr:cytochrome c biogenesis protein CcsA [Chloroflexota bacterium]
MNDSKTLNLSPMPSLYWPRLAGSFGQRAIQVLGVLSGVLSILALALALSAPRDTVTGDIYRILYFHVPSAWLAFLSFGVVALASLVYLWKRDRRWDVIALASAEFGVVMTTLTLISGSMWGYKVWGAWWVWDARLTLTLVMWLVYVGYLMLRAYVGSDEKRARYAAVLGIVGALDIPLIHFAVEWWRGQHPSAIVITDSGTKLAGPLLPPLMVSLLAFTLLYAFVMLVRVRLEQRRDQIALREMEAA